LLSTDALPIRIRISSLIEVSPAILRQFLVSTVDGGQTAMAVGNIFECPIAMMAGVYSPVWPSNGLGQGAEAPSPAAVLWRDAAMAGPLANAA
jgi:hypothetical protein